MAVEIIRRKEGEYSQKQSIRHEKEQIGINDWGHLVVRMHNGTSKRVICHLPTEKTEHGYAACTHMNYPQPFCCGDCKHAEYMDVQDEEHLIVFDRDTTNRIISFIQKMNPSHDFIQFLKQMANKKADDMPF